MKRSDVVFLAKSLMANHKSHVLSQSADRRHIWEIGAYHPAAMETTGYSWTLSGQTPSDGGDVSGTVVQALENLLKHPELIVTIQTYFWGNATLGFTNGDEEDYEHTSVPFMTGKISSISVRLDKYSLTRFDEPVTVP